MGEGSPAAEPRSRILLVIAGVFAYWFVILSVQNFDNITNYYFIIQDRYVLAFLVFLLVIVFFIKPRFTLTLHSLNRTTVFGIAAIVVLLLWLGTYAVMDNYALTRDEHMVLFDAYIFAGGKLSLPLAIQWSDFALSLVPAFLLDTPGNAALVSAYGPGNAAMRAGFRLAAGSRADEPAAGWDQPIGARRYRQAGIPWASQHLVGVRARLPAFRASAG